MKELLSNEEIDSLLALFRAESGGAPTTPQEAMGAAEEGGEDPPLVSPIDLLRPNRFGRERLHFLERLLASAAKAAASVLSERLRIDAVCDCVSVEQARFASWRRQLEGPIGIWSIAAPPFASPILLTMTGELLRGAVDRLLGGTGHTERSRDGFTQAEFAVAAALIEPLVERIATTFAEVVPLHPRVESHSGNPAMVQAMAPTDVALAAYFQVGGEVLHGDMRLAMAYQDLEPFLEKATPDRRSRADGRADHGELSSAVRALPVRLSAVLGRTNLSVRSLLGLRSGDVVRLDRMSDEPVEAEVEGVVKLRGRIGRRGSARVFRVDHVMGEIVDEHG